VCSAKHQDAEAAPARSNWRAIETEGFRGVETRALRLWGTAREQRVNYRSYSVKLTSMTGGA